MTAGNKKDDAPRKPRVPSSGEGADSALDALKKKRVPAPAPHPSSPPLPKS
jgi:hypothetical protein